MVGCFDWQCEKRNSGFPTLLSRFSRVLWRVLQPTAQLRFCRLKQEDIIEYCSESFDSLAKSLSLLCLSFFFYPQTIVVPSIRHRLVFFFPHGCIIGLFASFYFSIPGSNSEVSTRIDTVQLTFRSISVRVDVTSYSKWGSITPFLSNSCPLDRGCFSLAVPSATIPITSLCKHTICRKPQVLKVKLEWTFKSAINTFPESYLPNTALWSQDKYWLSYSSCLRLNSQQNLALTA